MEEVIDNIKKLEDRVSIEENKEFPNIDLIIAWNYNIASLNKSLTALQEKENILLRRESQGNLYNLFTTILI